MKKLNTTEDLLKLEKAVRKIINKSLKDRTLDYTVQFSVSSLEPKKVKYTFMINGTKQEVRIEPQVFESFDKALQAANAMIEGFSPIEIEKTFHISRLNTYKVASEQHQARLDYLNDPDRDKDFDDIPMEEMAAESLAKAG